MTTSAAGVRMTWRPRPEPAAARRTRPFIPRWTCRLRPSAPCTSRCLPRVSIEATSVPASGPDVTGWPRTGRIRRAARTSECPSGTQHQPPVPLQEPLRQQEPLGLRAADRLAVDPLRREPAGAAALDQAAERSDRRLEQLRLERDQAAAAPLHVERRA